MEEIPLHVQTNFYFNLGEELQYDFEANSPSHLPVVPPDLHGKSLEQLHDSPEQNTDSPTLEQHLAPARR